MHVLFVCTGNICRSPSAERLATMYAAALGIPDLRASSAGTHAVIGHPIHPDAAAVLKSLGADPAGFAARHLSAKIAADADVILTMTRAHREAVLELAPRQLRRTFTLAEAARLATEFGARDVADLAALRPRLRVDDLLDVPDPIGRAPDFFAQVGARIADLVRPVVELCGRSASSPGEPCGD